MDGIRSPAEQNSHLSAVKGQLCLHITEVGGTQGPGEQNCNHRTGMDGIQGPGEQHPHHSAAKGQHPGPGEQQQLSSPWNRSQPSRQLPCQPPARHAVTRTPLSALPSPSLHSHLSKHLPGGREPICKVSSYILSSASSAATQLPDVSASPPSPNYFCKLFSRLSQGDVTGRLELSGKRGKGAQIKHTAADSQC